MKPVVVQIWEESECGWGVRPDGYSIHTSEFKREQYIANYWKSMPYYAPDEYSRPCGSTTLLDISDSDYSILVDMYEGSRRYREGEGPLHVKMVA